MNPLRIKRGSDEPRNIDNTWSFFTLLHPTSLRLIRRFGGQREAGALGRGCKDHGA